MPVKSSTRARLALMTSVLALSAACGGPPQAPEAPAAVSEPAPVAQPAPSAPATAAPANARVNPPDLNTEWTPEGIAQGCEAAEKVMDAAIAAVVSRPAAQQTFQNAFGAVEDASAVFTETVSRMHFMKDVHGDPKVREAAAACQERSGKYVVGLGARKDLYDAFKGYLDNAGKTEALDEQQKRLIEINMRDFRRNGLELALDARTRLVEIRKRLAELETRYHQHLGEDKTTFEVALTDLAGMPEDFIARHEKTKDGKGIVLTVKYPDYFPVMENCKTEAVRRKMLHAFNNRGGTDNVKLLDEAAKLRAEAAKLLGYKTHSDFVSEPNMAKSAQTIRDFLTRMQTGLKPGLEAFRTKMVALKAADLAAAKGAKGKAPKGKAAAPTINAWDVRYYLNEIRKKDFAVDDEAMRAYFPAPKVLEGLFSLYSRLFGVRFVEVQGAKVWAEGVRLYEVRDAKDESLTARFYVDMYPREGKYGHAAEFNMAPGHAVPEGYRIPLSVLVVNFEPPANGKVAHLSVDEIETLFHEFGHVVHESLTTARYASLAGTNTARDFVEAPSQMLENWVYQPDVLALISEDPAKPGSPMPRELMDKIVQARNYDAGVAFTRQVYLGLFDQAMHTLAPTDTPDSDATAKRLWTEVAGFPEDQDTHFAASFGHMMGGYDAGYYGYLWSLVFAADMFTRFQTEGVLNPETGRAYRDAVLAMGRIRDADALLRAFLGREPNEKAFLTQLGIH